MIIAIDPGPEQSALVQYDDSDRTIVFHEKMDNSTLAGLLADRVCHPFEASTLAIEMIASYGMPVGAEVFQTCVWIGRFVQAWNGPHEFVYRREVKLHLCGSMRAKDGNVRQSLIDAFGGKAAIGTKKQPGPLYGIKADVWAALGVAVTYADREEQRQAA